MASVYLPSSLPCQLAIEGIGRFPQGDKVQKLTGVRGDGGREGSPSQGLQEPQKQLQTCFQIAGRGQRPSQVVTPPSLPFSPSPLHLLRSSSLPSLPHLHPSLTAPPVLFPLFATLLDSASKAAVSDPELGGSWGRGTRPSQCVLSVTPSMQHPLPGLHRSLCPHSP